MASAKRLKYVNQNQNVRAQEINMQWNVLSMKKKICFKPLKMCPKGVNLRTLLGGIDRRSGWG